jgi:hypothetical protein
MECRIPPKLDLRSASTWMNARLRIVHLEIWGIFVDKVNNSNSDRNPTWFSGGAKQSTNKSFS